MPAVHVVKVSRFITLHVTVYMPHAVHGAGAVVDSVL
jgi:hypothetical protein